ncbi:MAG TPA: nucleotide disphospho-sugar-binding domain-containing protein [Anaerolineales bacterium]|nr:nucleotide disphospho-sugar-binding domain-containing protein [Anaerolineales bacterium]
MKVLIAPMAAVAETSGPFSRAKALAMSLLQQGHTPAFCAAKDINYQQVEGVREYFAPLPSPMGLPMTIGKRAFGIAQRLGVQQRRKVRSFEEVLFIVGAIQERFFTEDVLAVRRAIQEFQPDVVYAEFRPAAIVAAKLENTRVAISYSDPARKAYASSPQYSRGVKRFLRKQGLPEIESVLDLFEWADLKIVPSCYELEPIDDPKVVFTGLFATPDPHPLPRVEDKDAIIVYMGSGSIAYRKQVSVLKQAFPGMPYQIYIASYQADSVDQGNLHVARRFDFRILLPRAITFINHGGQNSILSGIMSGVPQIVFPGNVFERQYNAAAVERLCLGKNYSDRQFNPSTIIQAVAEIRDSTSYIENINSIRSRLMKLGGVDQAIRSISAMCSE